MRRTGKVGVYGPKTRLLQRRLSYEVFGLTFKSAWVYKYLGDRNNANPDIDDIGSKVFYEVPDRAYDDTPIEVPIGKELFPEIKTDFSRFGIINPLQDEQIFRMHIDDFQPLGRDMIVGDVFQVEFFTKDGKKAFWEVTDVDLKSEYEKFIAIINAVPLGSARTTREIPIDRDNDALMDQIISDANDEHAEDMTEEGLFEERPETPVNVDQRNKTQKSFLDDPDFEF